MNIDFLIDFWVDFLFVKIILLDKGEIKEVGTHNELMEKEGLYSNLYNIQFS